MRSRLISAEIVAASAMLLAVVLVAPGELSKAYALLTIVAGVLPGLMLTGDVKLLNAGVTTGVSSLKLKALSSSALNVPLGAALLMMQEQPQPLPLLIVFVVVAALGATAQTFTSTWYYVQADKSRVLRSKAWSAGVKLAFSLAAVAMSELTLTLVGMTLGTLIEFALNFRALPWSATSQDTHRRQIVSPLGLAYGVSRLVAAGVRVGLAQLFGSLIASFLIIEQLVGGANSIFEKYFVRSTRGRNALRALKLAYLGAMAAVVPLLLHTPLDPSQRSALPWLVLVACAGLLPLAEMYAALQRRGQMYVAAGSSILSLSCSLLLAGAWLAGQLATASLLAYVALPGCTFLFYWLASKDARHNAQH